MVNRSQLQENRGHHRGDRGIALQDDILALNAAGGRRRGRGAGRGFAGRGGGGEESCAKERAGGQGIKG